MRIVFSILLFISFAIRPTMEISSILYYQLNIDYIVEKYCVNKKRPMLNCNGKCFLNKQLNIQKQSSSDQNDGIVINAETFLPLYFEKNKSYALHYASLTSLQKNNWSLKELHPFDIIRSIDHPPNKA
ncbi:hypothetical protein ACFSTE_04095 [Aquimarina hainanensis]|uniref:Uncharacterized protein n=1 Tax=Aquimarina hainanensis TaxID=1578017 RepID=A0ABW5N3B3_9FLAO|nr:hypothetical protein [Aquimarina sp. TRL1]QKX06018.1 hypothetical protein HN014_14260 [Aquimarina sp. TRL1]